MFTASDIYFCLNSQNKIAIHGEFGQKAQKSDK